MKTFLFICSLLLISSVSLADKKSDLEKVQSSLRQVKQIIKTDASKRNKKQSDLQKIERDISERQKRQQQTHQKQAALTQSVQELAIERDQMQTHLGRMKLKLAQLLRKHYQSGQQTKIKLLLSQHDPAKIARANRYFSYFAAQQSTQLETMKSATEFLTKSNAKLIKQQTSLSLLDATLIKDQRYLNKLKRNRLISITKLNQRIATNTDKEKALKARQIRLKKLLARIVARQKAKRRYKNILTNQQQNRSSKGTGRLPMPVSAPLLTYFGDKRPDSGQIWSGIMLGAKAGTAVKAIDSGEVVYSDWLQGYGQIVIVDHGQQLMSLYGHNSELIKSMGDSVVQGDTLARVGDTAGLTKAALYFEIRYKGRAENPLKWCRT